MNSRSRLVLFGVTAFIGALMISATSEAGQFGRVKKEIQQRCAEDGAGWWREPMQALQRVVLLGNIDDPATTGGELRPNMGNSDLGGGLELWLEKTPLQAVDLYIVPAIGAGNDRLVGPKIGKPEGVYRFEKLQAGDPRCEVYDKASRARRESRPSYGPILADTTACVGFRYIGAFDRRAYDHVEFSYLDKAALGRGYRRSVNVVMRTTDDQIVAQGVHYAIPGHPPTCQQDQYSIPDILAAGKF
jgi:hypothetical protein